MKHYFLGLLLLGFLSGCGGPVKVNQDELKKVKKVAVIVFALKSTIEHRDTPAEDDSDLGAALANETAFGDGETAANLAFPEFINTLNSKKLPFHVLTIKEMKANKKFMSLYKAPKKESKGNALTSFFGASAYARSPTGFMNFGMVEEYDKDECTPLTGKSGEQFYIQKAMEALKVDAALIVVDRGTSFQCNLACGLGNGDSSMGGAVHTLLMGRSGQTVAKFNFDFEGSSHALMARYIVNPLQRDKLYKAHGKEIATEYVKEFRSK